jgi:hypothetical protein
MIDEHDDDEDLSSFLSEEGDEEDDDLASFLEDDDDEEDDDLASFLEDDEEEDEDEGDDEDEYKEEEEDEDMLSSFFDDEPKGKSKDKEGGLLDMLSGSSKPEPVLKYKREKRKARIDITKNSKEDHRYIKRYTKKEIDDQLKKDYKYSLGKPYMIIQPLTIIGDYPFKKKSGDSDIPNEYNVELDYIICIGKILKWRGTEQFKGKPYKLGEIMYMKRGDYWVNGKIETMDPHFAIVLKKSYKRIKSKRIRDLFKPLKQRLRSGKPFGIYKDFPIIVKRSGSYS